MSPTHTIHRTTVLQQIVLHCTTPVLGHLHTVHWTTVLQQTVLHCTTPVLGHLHTVHWTTVLQQIVLHCTTPVLGHLHTVHWTTVLQQIALHCTVLHFALLSHPLGDLWTMYDVNLGLIGERVVDFLLVINELFR